MLLVSANTHVEQQSNICNFDFLYFRKSFRNYETPNGQIEWTLIVDIDVHFSMSISHVFPFNSHIIKMAEEVIERLRQSIVERDGTVVESLKHARILLNE